MSPLALQTCQNLRKIQVKGLAIQGKTKDCTITNMQKKGKRNKYRLAIEGKRRNTGVQGGVPLSAGEKKIAKSLERYKKKDFLFKEKQKTVRRKSRNGGQRGVLALKTETLRQ